VHPASRRCCGCRDHGALPGFPCFFCCVPALQEGERTKPEATGACTRVDDTGKDLPGCARNTVCRALETTEGAHAHCLDAGTCAVREGAHAAREPGDELSAARCNLLEVKRGEPEARLGSA